MVCVATDFSVAIASANYINDEAEVACQLCIFGLTFAMRESIESPAGKRLLLYTMLPVLC